MSFDVVVSKLEKFEEKIDGICSKINNIDKNLGLLKQHVEIQNGRIKKNEVKIEAIREDLSPNGFIGKKVEWINSKVLLALGGLSSIGVIALVLTILATIMSFLK